MSLSKLFSVSFAPGSPSTLGRPYSRVCPGAPGGVVGPNPPASSGSGSAGSCGPPIVTYGGQCDTGMRDVNGAHIYGRTVTVCNACSPTTDCATYCNPESGYVTGTHK